METPKTLKEIQKLKEIDSLKNLDGFYDKLLERMI